MVETSLFSWKTWQGVIQVHTFHQVTLNTDVKDFKKGTKFDIAVIDYDKATIKFWNYNNDKNNPLTLMFEGTLKLSVE